MSRGLVARALARGRALDDAVERRLPASWQRAGTGGTSGLLAVGLSQLVVGAVLLGVGLLTDAGVAAPLTFVLLGSAFALVGWTERRR